mmetsp:Transcript_35540/g.80183  ORF Transcript_35540/g.80183 Transcript_35540/m.80183 type:complete len:793 (-) Transcript_35540:159-2537(-)
MFGGFFSCCCQEEDVDKGQLNNDIDHIVDACSPNGDVTALWAAAAAGESGLVKKLITSGVDPNAPDTVSTPRSRKSTALLKAARAGHASVVNVLIQDSNTDVNASTMDEVTPVRSKQTPLHWAAREGHAEVIRTLLTSPKCDPNLKTQLGFSAAMIAAQNGFLETLKPMSEDPRVDLKYAWITPETVELSAMLVALIEGQVPVVRHLATLQREDKQDINGLSRNLYCRSTLLHFATQQKNTNIVEVLLSARADPDIPSEQGETALEVAVMSDTAEIILLLLSGKANSDKCFSQMQRAQIDGDGPLLLKLYGASGSQSSILPGLHRAVLDKSMDQLTAEIKKCQKGTVMKTLDGGNLPAAYWAIELGQWDQAAVLLQEHNMQPEFVQKLVRGDFGKISQSPSTWPGERAFEVFKALLAEEARIVVSAELAKGAFALLKPFCGSVVALNYFKQHPENFNLLRQLCVDQIYKIYSRIDADVGLATLQKLGKVALTENRAGARQDDTGLLPELAYFIDEEKNMKMGGNGELYCARSLSLGAIAVNNIFMSDMKETFNKLQVEVVEAPPKNYTRMFNKLMNPLEHGDPSIAKPRPMRNIDVLRIGLVISSPDDLEKAYLSLKARHRILRVKNNHDPGAGEGFGGYRNLLINFAYDTGVRIKDLFGEGYYGVGDNGERRHLSLNATGEKWMRYCRELKPWLDWSWGVQAWWRAGRREPERRLIIAGEVQMILADYMQGRHLSHLLYKISRCDSGTVGACEMARDFAASFTEKSSELEDAQAEACAIAQSLRAAGSLAS